MSKLTIAAILLLAGCPGASAPPPIERATPVVHETPTDAGVPVAVAPTPDAAIEDEPPAELSPLDQLPPSGEDPLPEMPSQDLIDARLALAEQHAREPLGLSLLLDIANAAGGSGTLDHTRWDDTWRSQWDNPAFAIIVTLAPPQDDGAEPDLTAPLVCPKDTKAKHKGFIDWCQKGNGTKHGPYRYYEEGYDMSEGLAYEYGDYADGKKSGMWRWSESFSGWSAGGYVKGVKRGLWEVGDRETYDYVAYVDGKEQGLVVTKSGEGDDVTVAERHYDRGVLHGELREWQTTFPYALVQEGAYDHGKKTGEWRQYDAAGVIRAVQHWDADVADGDYSYFDETGAVLATGHLDHGTGDWTEFDDYGLRAQGHLEKGVKQGKWGERELYGEAWETGDYKDGKRDGAWVEYAVFAGDKVSGGDYKNGARVGAWIWLDGGTVKATGSFANGKPTGHWELTDQNGTQTLDIKGGKLVKLDGKKPTKGELEAFKRWAADDPKPIYEYDAGALY